MQHGRHIYFIYWLEPVGGRFFPNRNYKVSDYTISSQFYHELLLWWSEFRKSFASGSDWKTILWNNKEIRIDNRPMHYKNYIKSGIIYIHDLLFNLNTMDSYDYFLNKLSKAVFCNGQASIILCLFIWKKSPQKD